MITKNFTVHVLEPSEGYVLTQVDDVNIEDRILSYKVYLAVNDSPDNWKEITETKAKEYRDEQDRIAKEMESKR